MNRFFSFPNSGDICDTQFITNDTSIPHSMTCTQVSLLQSNQFSSQKSFTLVIYIQSLDVDLDLILFDLKQGVSFLVVLCLTTYSQQVILKMQTIYYLVQGLSYSLRVSSHLCKASFIQPSHIPLPSFHVSPFSSSHINLSRSRT